VTPPAAEIIDVTPDPRTGAVTQVTIAFTEPVTGFELADLRLSRDGAANLCPEPLPFPPSTTSPGRSVTWPG
jgi:hypothetical protein